MLFNPTKMLLSFLSFVQKVLVVAGVCYGFNKLFLAISGFWRLVQSLQWSLMACSCVFFYHDPFKWKVVKSAV